MPRGPEGLTEHTSSVRTEDKPLPVERITALLAENRRLRQKLWHLQFRSTLTAGMGLIGAGAASLALAYFTSSVAMTLAGLGLAFWGAIFLYISPFKYVPENVLGSLSLSTIKSIDKLLASMNYTGRTIFLHPKHLKGLTQGYVFIPHESSGPSYLPNDKQLVEERTMYKDPKGMFLVAPSQGLVDLVEKELDINLATVDLPYLKENLAKILVNNLRVIDSIAIEEHPDFILVNVGGDSAAKLCKSVSKETSIGDHFGCPLCSALALMISKVTGRPVTIHEMRPNDIDGIITTTYRTLEPIS
jgi:hypothetical protein